MWNEFHRAFFKTSFCMPCLSKAMQQDHFCSFNNCLSKIEKQLTLHLSSILASLHLRSC